ncbi:sugar phosphate isomerase/epimerase family protein [Paenibacillus solisilvae]|uniref:Sugar phosphate isomerase/epimerase family protein n=1 Tax=Paenibacillus solisilvae TaxID=2486751 RepID=A0ABW0VRY3_9BACL
MSGTGDQRCNGAPAAKGVRRAPFTWEVGTSYRLETAENFERDIEAMAVSGIRYVELAWRNEVFDMSDPAKELFCDTVIRRARACGLDVWSIHLPYGTSWDVSNPDKAEREEAVRRHARLLELAGRWNIRTAVLHPSWEPIADAERRERLAACKRSLAELAAAAVRNRIRLAAECLPRTCLGNTSGEMALLAAASVDLGVCCDVNHLVQEPPEAFIRKLGSRIVTLHMSDNDGTDEKHWMPGAGVIDWIQVLGELAGAGYEGPFMFEVRQYEPRELMDCWRQLLVDCARAWGTDS